MAEIIDLNELVPDDVVVKIRDEQYLLPGDLTSGDTLRLYKLFRKIGKLEAAIGAEALGEIETTGNLSDTAEEKLIAHLERSTNEAKKELLKLFQIRQPDMRELPPSLHGSRAVGALMLWLLKELGFVEEVPAGEGEGDAEDPPTRAPAKGRKATSVSSRKSRR